MKDLELLAPARNLDIGIAAIDCGADAVYIAGPSFGARKDAGNSFDDIARLCAYAHRFGVRIFVTVNILLKDEELDEVHAQMLKAQDAGVDAFIIRDTRICTWNDITVPLHASTQCAIRDLDTARRYADAGCSRVVLERQLPLSEVRRICDGLGNTEVEFFVHGALCMGYSGQCTLSEYIDGRSGDRGECIQACRSLYDLQDSDGRILMRDKALLSLKDYNLIERLPELADAGVCSFKIEGRLKSVSYVRNVVRAYSQALDRFVANSGGRYRRASFGRVSGGFAPDLAKTFNRGYTQLFIDGERGSWAGIDAPKSMGERIGRVVDVRRDGKGTLRLTLDKVCGLANGDGFAFLRGSSIVGFRGDVCEGRTIICKEVQGLRPGVELWRNISAAFERTLERESPSREMSVDVRVSILPDGELRMEAQSEDGRSVVESFIPAGEPARDSERMLSLIGGQISKRSGIYAFRLSSLDVNGPVMMMRSADINALRRSVADRLDAMAVLARPMYKTGRPSEEVILDSRSHIPGQLMRSKYCLRYELGMCPVRQGAKPSGRLFLVNNGRRLELKFDCERCEMTVATVGDND